VAVLYPVLLVAAAALGWRSRGRPGGRGPWWFFAWTLAGFSITFSFLTGLSIGLFILPPAAALLLWVAPRSPHLLEGAGFFIGIAANAALILALHGT